MSAIDIWMPLYIGDYLADTRRLSTVEHGAYLLLLMEQWRRGWIADDDQQLARITGLRVYQWRKMAGTLRAFFDAGDLPGTMRQKRLHAEREKALGISAKRADAARAKHERTPGEPGKGGIREPDLVHVGGRDSEPNSLKSQDADSANAEQKQAVCTYNHNYNYKEEVVSPLLSPPVPVAVPVPAEKRALPPWLNPSLWADWCQHRKGRAWTQRAAEMSLEHLDRLRQAGNDPDAVIRQAIAGGYTGFVPTRSPRGQVKEEPWWLTDAKAAIGGRSDERH